MTAQMDAGVTGFTNGNSLIQDGQGYAGAAVVSNTEITWTRPHLVEMPAQRAELAALKKSLEQRKDIKVIKATFYGGRPLPVKLQPHPVKTWPLPVTLTVTSGH